MTDYPTVVINIPWEVRRGMRWPHTDVYLPRVPPVPRGEQWPFAPMYSVPIPIDLIDMPWTKYRIRSARDQIDARSRFAPAVYVEGITYTELSCRIADCAAANVRADKVFAGQDIRVAVRPYDYENVRVRGTGLSLMGVTLIASPDDNWTPVPNIGT